MEPETKKEIKKRGTHKDDSSFLTSEEKLLLEASGAEEINSFYLDKYKPLP